MSKGVEKIAATTLGTSLPPSVRMKSTAQKIEGLPHQSQREAQGCHDQEFPICEQTEDSLQAESPGIRRGWGSAFGNGATRQNPPAEGQENRQNQ
jgi:hypothetical protein